MSETITTIEELITALDASSKKDRDKVVAKIDLEAADLKQYSTWESGDYTRNCLARTDDYEIILLCWDKNSATPIHGHGGQDCWVYQVEGDVLEMRFNEKNDELKLSEKLKLGEGDVSYMTDEMGYHLIKNEGKEKAMTLHIYAGPIDACEVYDNEINAFKVADMEYDEIFDEVISV